VKDKPLNSFTQAELKAAQERALAATKAEKPCRWCGQVSVMTRLQVFCSPACKTAYHNLSREEKRRQEIDSYKKEIEELYNEIRCLRTEVAALKAKLGS
jgi:hypothetical protein